MAWFETNQRELPFRYTKDIYKIWLSEIIFQQTQIKQGLPYYQKFIEAFPTIEALANAHEQEVLKLWEGLGYYSRARNLHHCAKAVVATYGGEFPADYKSLTALKGIGDYTARAILSFGFKAPYAVVDGNVFRIVTRFFGTDTPIDTTQGKKEIQALADDLLDAEKPDIYNNAIMDFGAVVCTAKNPFCLFCPVQKKCVAFSENRVAHYPQKSKKITKKKRYFYYLLPKNNNGIFLHKRQSKDIWRHLFEPPVIESAKPLSLKCIKEQLDTPNVLLLDKLTHQLTHQEIQISFLQVGISDFGVLDEEKDYVCIDREDLSKYPLPKPIATFFEKEK